MRCPGQSARLAHPGTSGESGWKAAEDRTATRTETRYGCFLPDLTGLARGSSAAGLPEPSIGIKTAFRKRGVSRGRLSQESGVLAQKPDEALIAIGSNQLVQPVLDHH